MNHRSAYQRSLHTISGLRHSTAGFSAVEVVIVLVILGLLLSVAVPAMGEAVRHTQVNRAISVVHTDLTRARSLAARQRAPVRIEFTTGNKSYVFTDAVSGDTLFARSFDENTEFDLSSMAVSSSTVEIAPSGFASAAIVVVVRNEDYARALLMLRAGLVRVFR